MYTPAKKKQEKHFQSQKQGDTKHNQTAGRY